MHCVSTLVMFERPETSLVGMNFFDLMEFYNKNFFKTNSLWDHHLFFREGLNVVRSSRCNLRVIRYSTPHSEHVTYDTMNVLTSKLVSITITKKKMFYNPI